MPATPFADRTEAGRLLAAELSTLADRRPVVFGLPRCGVPVAYEIAQRLGAPLDVMLVRTVRAPDDRSRLLATVLEGDPPEVRIEPDWDRAPAVSRAWLDAQVSEALRGSTGAAGAIATAAARCRRRAGSPSWSTRRSGRAMPWRAPSGSSATPGPR